MNAIMKMNRFGKTALIGVASFGLLFSIVTLTGCSGCNGAQGKFLTNLYRYYPENTAYFVEMNASEANAKQMLATADKLSQKFAKSSVDSPKKLQTEYPKYFENRLSVGAWLPSKPATAGDAKAAPAEEKAAILVAIPVKGNTSFDAIQKGLELNKPVASTIKTAKGKTTQAYSMNNGAGSSSVMALVDNTLLIAENEAALTAALNTAEGDKNISTHELVKQHLGVLDANRQGTLVTVQQPEVLAQMAKKGPKENQQLTNFVQQIQEVAPLSIGGIKIDDSKQLVDVTSYTPLDFAKVKNEQLRKALENALLNGQALELPANVSKDSILAAGMFGLSQYYDIYMTYFATAADKVTIQEANDQLKMMNLDLRKNVIALFDQTTAISVTNWGPGKTDLALLLNSNAETRRTIEQLTTMASQMAQGQLQEQDANGKKFKTLSSPAMPFKLAFGETQPNKVLAIGTLPSIQVLPAFSKGPNLDSNVLYSELNKGLNGATLSFVFVNLEALAQQMPEMAELKSLGIQGGVAVNGADKGKKMLVGQIRWKWAKN